MIGIPGTRCDICGEMFLTEMLMGTSVPSFTLVGCDQKLHAHKDCFKEIKKCGGDWKKLPNGPIRIMYEKVEVSKATGGTDGK